MSGRRWRATVALAVSLVLTAVCLNESWAVRECGDGFPAFLPPLGGYSATVVHPLHDARVERGEALVTLAFTGDGDGKGILELAVDGALTTRGRLEVQGPLAKMRWPLGFDAHAITWSVPGECAVTRTVRTSVVTTGPSGLRTNGERFVIQGVRAPASQAREAAQAGANTLFLRGAPSTSDWRAINDAGLLALVDLRGTPSDRALERAARLLEPQPRLLGVVVDPHRRGVLADHGLLQERLVFLPDPHGLRVGDTAHVLDVVETWDAVPANLDAYGVVGVVGPDLATPPAFDALRVEEAADGRRVQNVRPWVLRGARVNGEDRGTVQPGESIAVPAGVPLHVEATSHHGVAVRMAAPRLRDP